MIHDWVLPSSQFAFRLSRKDCVWTPPGCVCVLRCTCHRAERCWEAWQANPAVESFKESCHLRRNCGDTERAATVNCSKSAATPRDRKSTRLNSSHSQISYAVFCL